MGRNRETPALLASLVVTAGLIGGGLWWFNRSGALNLGSVLGDNGAAPTDSGGTASDPGEAANPSMETFAEVDNVPEGVFNYGGSTTWAPIRGAIDPILQQVHPRFQLRYTDPVGVPVGSGSGIAMLLESQLSFAQSSRPLTPEERQQGIPLKEIPVAIEGLAIAVHPDLAVDGLTLAQLRDIYLGTLTNWSEVGGPNLPITPISRPADGGTVEFFVNTVLGGTALPGTVQSVGTTTEALRVVSNTPGSIYYASAPEVVGQCTVKPIAIGRDTAEQVTPYAEPYVPASACPAQRNQINIEGLRSGTYPLTRRLFVILREDGSADQQAAEAYANLLLTQQGQSLLAEQGFVPIR